MQRTGVLALAVALSLPAVPLGAQERVATGGAELVDRVVAIAGDSVILATQVDERILQLQASGAQLPQDPAGLEALRTDLIETLVNEQLIIQAALRDSTITVSEDELERTVTRDLDNRMRNMGGQAAMQQALSAQGLTMSGFRELLKEQARRQQLQGQYVAKRRQAIGAISVSETEVRGFIDSQRDRLPRRPASITFRQVLIRPEPSDSARAAAKAEAERILAMVREGQEFEALARRFSQDPGSTQQGGDLGWFRRGVMVEEFENAAFSLPEGATSEVVETEFGAHIIRVERIRSAERKVRHILIRAETGPADLERARALAGDVLRRAEAGESMKALSREFGDPSQPDSVDLFVDQLGDLPPGYADALSSPTVGQVVGPIEWGPDGGKTLAVVKVIDTRPEGEYTYEDLRARVQGQLQEEKLIQRIIDDLRARSYVEIRN